MEQAVPRKQPGKRLPKFEAAHVGKMGSGARHIPRESRQQFGRTVHTGHGMPARCHMNAGRIARSAADIEDLPEQIGNIQKPVDPRALDKAGRARCHEGGRVAAANPDHIGRMAGWLGPVVQIRPVYGRPLNTA